MEILMFLGMFIACLLISAMTFKSTKNGQYRLKKKI